MQEARKLVQADEYEGALEMLRPFDRESTNASIRPHVQVMMGELQRALGLFDSALGSLRSAESTLGEGGQSQRVYLLAVRAQIHQDVGLLDVAARELRIARELLLRLEAGVDPLATAAERIQVDYARATLAAGREDYGELDQVVEEALLHPVYEKYPARAMMLRARRGLGLEEAARMDGTLAERARADLEEALRSELLPPLERVLPELALGDLALRERNFEECQALLELAGRDLGASPGREGLPQFRSWLALSARLALERDDPRVESEVLEGLRVRTAKAMDEGVKEWSLRELRPGGYGFLQYAEERSLLSEWIRLELRLAGEEQGARRALERVLSTGDASTLARRLLVEPVSFEQALSEVLGPAEEHVLLVYLPAPDRSHLFVADRERVRHVFLAPHDTIQAARLELARTLGIVSNAGGAKPSEAAQAAWRDALERMRSLLLPEDAVEAIGARQRWTVIGRDLLGDVPFDALPLGPGKWLGCERTLSHLPSLAVGRALAARAAREERRSAKEEGVLALLLAAPEATQLSLGAKQADEMLAPWPGRARRVAWGRAATADALRADCSGAQMLQLFTHAVFDPELERPMTLVLDDGKGGERRFDASEVESLDAPPLVVLAVCKTGSGPKRRGDASAAELASAFFLAGKRTRCVIASAFDLEAESTRRLSRALHAGLVAGLAPDEALRSARVELTRDERFADPRFHGLVFVLGAARDPLLGP